VCRVSEQGVEVVRWWSQNERPIEAFIDADEVVRPKSFLFRPAVQLIVASSPRGPVPDWTKQADLGGPITQLVVKLWSYKELFLTGLVMGLLSSLV
jgi:hypothetical protein